MGKNCTLSRKSREWDIKFYLFHNSLVKLMIMSIWSPLLFRTAMWWAINMIAISSNLLSVKSRQLSVWDIIPIFSLPRWEHRLCLCRMSRRCKDLWRKRGFWNIAFQLVNSPQTVLVINLKVWCPITMNIRVFLQLRRPNLKKNHLKPQNWFVRY